MTTDKAAKQRLRDRSWKMFAGRMSDRGRIHVYPDARTVTAYGDDPTPVVVMEDPEGSHYGWIGGRFLHYEPDEFPTMIQPHKGMFDMQFPYGPEAEQKRGHGEIIRLSVSDA